MTPLARALLKIEGCLGNGVELLLAHRDGLGRTEFGAALRDYQHTDDPTLTSIGPTLAETLVALAAQMPEESACDHVSYSRVYDLGSKHWRCTGCHGPASAPEAT